MSREDENRVKFLISFKEQDILIIKDLIIDAIESVGSIQSWGWRYPSI